jgi:uncharacterized damage-inducible protein DinB
MLSKQEFLAIYKWELPALQKVVAAIPEAGQDYRPDPKSRTAMEVSITLIVELRMIMHFLDGKSIGLDGGDFYSKVTPATIAEAVLQLVTASQELLSKLEQMTDEQLKAKVTFFHRETTVDDAIFNMLLDIIHHRGQLSSYLRAAGGKVPSIYGPSGDEEFKA